MLTLSDQLYTFGYSILAGLLIALLYDIFRIKRKVLGSGTISLMLEDFLYWIFTGIILFTSIFYICHGIFRVYIFIANIFGIIFYIILFSKKIMKIGIFILKTFIRPFKYFTSKMKGICNKTVE